MLSSLLITNPLANDFSDLGLAVAFLVIAAVSALSEKIKKRAEQTKRDNMQQRPPAKPVPPIARGDRPVPGTPVRPRPPVQRTRPPAQQQRPVQRPQAQRSPHQVPTGHPVTDHQAPKSALTVSVKPEQIVQAVEIKAHEEQLGQLTAHRDDTSKRKRGSESRRRNRSPLGRFGRPSSKEIRRAIIWSEILRPPLALRDPAEGDS